MSFTEPPIPSLDVCDDPVRVFVGTDRSQEIAFRVLTASIRRRTALGVEVTSLANLDLPEPSDPAHRARTGFSFARFAIPELAGRTGRAIYLDADMLVLQDIGELWHLPLGEAKLACQEDMPDGIAVTAPVPGARRGKQCSVMVMDCARLDWDARRIISGLGPHYTYEQLLGDMCILEESEISYSVPSRWNSLEHADGSTCLVHYTDMMTQPWVYAGNRNGWLWVRELRDLLASGVLDLAFIRAEIAEGYLRPSIERELDLPLDGPLPPGIAVDHQDLDRRAGFHPHASLANERRITTRVRRVFNRLLGSV